MVKIDLAGVRLRELLDNDTDKSFDEAVDYAVDQLKGTPSPGFLNSLAAMLSDADPHHGLSFKSKQRGRPQVRWEVGKFIHDRVDGGAPMESAVVEAMAKFDISRSSAFDVAKAYEDDLWRGDL